MSGHSKWASIKHKKGAADAKRGKIFSKLSKAITIAAKDGGTDVAMNFTLRLAVEKAKQANMPKDNIARAILKGGGTTSDGTQLQTVVYEAIGPGGSAILIEAVTDNTNRALTNIKNIINKSGANMGAKVKWMFDRKGVTRVEDVSEIKNKDDLELSLIEAGAEDIAWDDGLEVVCEISDLKSLKEVLESQKLEIKDAGLEFVAKDKIKISDEDEEKLFSLMDKLDDDDDVSNIFTNVQ